MSVKCTWVDCEAEGTVPQTGKDGSEWAKLCEDHHKKLDEAMASGDVKKWMGSYIKAQGGAKAAADRMAPAAAQAVGTLVDVLKGLKK